jgi:hypothetical protein
MKDKFEVEFIDSRGVDQSAIRPDIMAHVSDPRTLVLLCSRFGSAPDAAIHELLKHVNSTDVDPTLSERVSLLLLPRSGEALSVLDEITGERVDSVIEGYERKKTQLENAVAGLGSRPLDVMFLDAASDKPNEFVDELTNRLRRMRSRAASQIEFVHEAIEELFANRGRAAAQAAQAAVAKSLAVYIAQHQKAPERQRSVHSRFLDRLDNGINGPFGPRRAGWGLGTILMCSFTWANRPPAKRGNDPRLFLTNYVDLFGTSLAIGSSLPHTSF